MLNELRGSIDELSENFNIKMKMEILKRNQLEMKNTLSENKEILEGINRVDKKEDRTTDMEDREAKNTQSEWQEKWSHDYNNNFKSLYDTIKFKKSLSRGYVKENKNLKSYLKK